MEKSFAKIKSTKPEYPSVYTGKRVNESVCIEIDDKEENKMDSEEEEVEDFLSFAQNISKKLKTSPDEFSHPNH